MHQKALLALILAATIAGTNGLFIKSMTSISPTAIAWVRGVIPTVVLLIWIKWQKMPLWQGNMSKMMTASIINAIRLYFYLIAFIFTSMGNAVILFYTWPIFAALFGAYYLKEGISRYHLYLLFVSFIGLITTYSEREFSFNDRDFLGMMAAILSAIGYAMTVVLFKSEAHRYHRNQIILYQNMAGAVLFLPFFILNAPDIIPRHLLIAISYASIIGLGVFGLFFFALKYLKATYAAAMMYLEVVSTVLFSYLFFGEQLSIAMMIGGAMIIVSSFLISRIRQPLLKVHEK